MRNAVIVPSLVAAVIAACMIAARSRGTTQKRIADWLAGSQLTQEEPQP